MDLFDHALDAFLRWPESKVCLAGSRRMHLPKRISQEVELFFRALADSCLLLVDRELQSSHDLTQPLQSFFTLALAAQNHEIIGIGHDAGTKALFHPQLLPSQYEPAHVQIRQRR